MSTKALLVLQQKTSTPGRVGDRLAARGLALDMRRPALGDALPDSFDDYAVTVIFGGPMSANDGDSNDAIRAQLDWVPKAVEDGTPYLGICLGAQLLAKASGAAVAPRPDGVVEIGYSEIVPTPAGRAFFDGPLHAYQWHAEGFDLPAGAVLLAEGSVFRNQAFRFDGNAYGLQFHPEVTRAMLDLWTTEAAHKLDAPGAQGRGRQLDGFSRHDEPLGRWLDGFLDQLLAGTTTAAGR